MTQRDTEHGLTLVEVLLTLAILALAVSVSTAALRPTRSADLPRLTSEIASALRDARTRAITRAVEQTVRIDLTRRSITADGRTVMVAPDVSIRTTTARTVSLDQGQADIQFYPDGGASGGQIQMRRAGRTMRIDISWLTGAVTVHQGGAP